MVSLQILSERHDRPLQLVAFIATRPFQLLHAVVMRDAKAFHFVTQRRDRRLELDDLVMGEGDRGLDALLLFDALRSEEHTSELQSLMRISYAVFCLKKKKTNIKLY